MATMITNDCINCGACEPECPNNAISQGDPVYVIDPLLCTECVGFHDYEACAAVCPVDVCVTDPNNIETEEALIARARKLHPEIQIGDNFESRFRKGEGKGAAPAPQKAVPPRPVSPDPKSMETSAPSVPAPAAAFADDQINTVELPDIGSWTIPMRCFRCNEVHVEPVENFMIGNVIFCPHCHKSVVVRDNLNFHIRSLMNDAYDNWKREQREFATRRERELNEFKERRDKDAEAFETHQKRALEKIRQELDAIGETYDAPGRPLKRGARFAWG
jgi:hypothetical protein